MMKIRIYQINSDRDKHRMMFMRHETLEKFQGSSEVDCKIYDKIYDKEVACNNLEGVYRMLNEKHPPDYKGRSLSVSDVVEVYESDSVDKGFYFCDSFGFTKVSFNPNECEVSERLNSSVTDRKITVLLVKPKMRPVVVTIADNYEAMQAVVGGNIEEYMPFDDEVALVCNREGKLIGLPMNRAIHGNDGEINDIIAGDFFLAFAPVESETYLDMPKEMLDKYAKRFKNAERFERTESGFKAIQYKPIRDDMER